MSWGYRDGSGMAADLQDLELGETHFHYTRVSSETDSIVRTLSWLKRILKDERILKLPLSYRDSVTMLLIQGYWKKCLLNGSGGEDRLLIRRGHSTAGFYVM